MRDYRKNVLVFGATGEIGSRVLRGCVDAGCRVTGVSRGENSRHRVALDGSEMVNGDKGDRDFVAKLATAHRFDVIIDTVPNKGHMQLAYECFRGRIGKYFICSSTGAYPPLRYLPADEEHPWREKTGLNFTGTVEKDIFALDLWREHRFPVTVFRPTNIIGAGRVPIETWGSRNIAYFKRLKAGEPVEIPGDGNTLLQSGLNDDLAGAFVRGVGCGPETNGEVFVISSRRAITLRRYFETACAVLDSRSTAEYLPPDEIVQRRPEQVKEGNLRFLNEHMCFDIGKAERMLGYAPRATSEDGLVIALEWCLAEGLLDSGLGNQRLHAGVALVETMK